MASYLPPTKGVEYIFYICLESQASAGTFQANPTIAAGDFTVSTDGGSFSNLDTTPTVTPASGVQVKVTVSATEMNGDNILVAWQDAAGAQWYSGFALIQPAAQTFDTIDANVDSVLADTGTDGVVLTSTERTTLAKLFHTIDWDTITGEAARSTLNALRFLRNKRGISGTTMTVTKEDDSTSAWTATLTTTSNPDGITEIDPA